MRSNGTSGTHCSLYQLQGSPERSEETFLFLSMTARNRGNMENWFPVNPCSGINTPYSQRSPGKLCDLILHLANKYDYSLLKYSLDNLKKP